MILKFQCSHLFLVVFFPLKLFQLTVICGPIQLLPSSLGSLGIHWFILTVSMPVFPFLKSRLCPQCQIPFLLIELKMLSSTLPVEHSQKRCFVLVLRIAEDPLATTARFWTLTPKKKKMQLRFKACVNVHLRRWHDVCVCARVISCRQHLTPCEAELTLSGHEKIKSTASNYWLGHMIQRTNHVFTGGLPQKYPFNQVSHGWGVSWLPYMLARCISLR